MDERARQRQFEDSFLSQLRARALAVVGGKFPADAVEFDESPAEGRDALRDELSRLEGVDRADLYEQLPGKRTLNLRFKKALVRGLWSRRLGNARARVLVPVEALVADRLPGPLGRSAVQLALDRYAVIGERHRPKIVVLASASGFSPDARSMATQQTGGAALVLLGGRPDGGWDVDMHPALRAQPWARLFELESHDDRLKRLLGHLNESAVELDSRGVPLPALAERLGLSQTETELLVRQACRTHARLMTVSHNGTMHVCRAPLAEEGETMSVWSRVRKWLGFKPSVAERVREMTAQRVALEQQRHEVDQRLNALEADERAALQQGAAAPSEAEKRQVAGRLMRVRRELSRVRAQANVFSQQIEILGTHIHHLTLAEQGRRLDLPKAEDLTHEAAQAEQTMAELAANADLAHSIEIGAATPMMQQEEADILAEFNQIAAAQPAASPAVATPERQSDRVPPSASPARQSAGVPPVPASAEKNKARPEVG
ncbi:MAG: hypothetical protein U1D55_01105 [Phycisphaerae bacterium]